MNADQEADTGAARPPRDARRIPAIVNTDARTAALAIAALEKAGAFDVREASGRDVTTLVSAALAEGHRRIVVAGGDGTIASAASVLAGTNTDLAVVPGGTHNHFAGDHGIPADLDEAVALARAGTARGVDIARVNGRVFLNTSSVGAYVSFVRVRDRLEPYLGYVLASLVAVARVFFTMHRFVVEISGPHGRRILRTPLLFIGVGERELKLPLLGARVPDGRAGLHLMVVRGRTRGAMLALAFAAATRGIRGITPRLDATVLDRCTVRLRHHTAIATDGEVVRLESPLTYELLPGHLRVVLP
jgi:diacylglycerol kinase family enzyme